MIINNRNMERNWCTNLDPLILTLQAIGINGSFKMIMSQLNRFDNISDARNARESRKD